MTNKEAKEILEWELNNFKYTDNEFVEATKVAIKALEERPKGKWELVNPLQANDGGAYMCSFCKTGSWGFDKTYNFCPNCGADMRGDV